jgi:hypothetical protein
MPENLKPDEIPESVLYLRRIAEVASKIPAVTGRDREILERCFDAVATAVNRAEGMIYMANWKEETNGD